MTTPGFLTFPGKPSARFHYKHARKCLNTEAIDDLISVIIFQAMALILTLGHVIIPVYINNLARNHIYFTLSFVLGFW